jgi:hypothetical protein
MKEQKNEAVWPLPLVRLRRDPYASVTLSVSLFLFYLISILKESFGSFLTLLSC